MPGRYRATGPVRAVPGRSSHAVRRVRAPSGARRGGRVDRGDAGEDQVDPGEELRAVVVVAHLVGDGPQVGHHADRAGVRQLGTEGTRLYELMFGDDAPRGLIRMFTGS